MGNGREVFLTELHLWGGVTNFYPVAVTNLFSQVQYMKAVVGSYTTTNVSLIAPRSEHLVCRC